MKSVDKLNLHASLSPEETWGNFAPVPPFLPEQKPSGIIDRLASSKMATALGSVALDAASGLKRWWNAPAHAESHTHHHHEDEHEDSEEHHDDPPMMSERTSVNISRLQLGAAAVNGVVMLWKGAREGARSINAASAVDAVHNIFDWAKWRAEAFLDHHNLPPRAYKIVRGLTCAALAGGGAWSIADATVLHSEYNAGQGIASTVSAGAALATAGIVGNAIGRKYNTEGGLVDVWRGQMTGRDKDKLIHALTDIPVSVGASVANMGVVLGDTRALATAATISGGSTAIGYFGIYAPFIRGLDKEDACALHDHSKDKSDHAGKSEESGELRAKSTPELLAMLAEHRDMWDTMEARKIKHEKRASWWRRSIAIGSLAAAACIGATGTAQQASVAPTTTPTPARLPSPETSIESYVTVQPGDSQWSIARQEVIKASNVSNPEEPHIHEVAQYIKNSNLAIAPLPYLIHPDEQLFVPSSAMIRTIISQ